MDHFFSQVEKKIGEILSWLFLIGNRPKFGPLKKAEKDTLQYNQLTDHT